MTPLTSSRPRRASKQQGVRIYSWNINGIRAATKKGLVDWLGVAKGEIFALQEVRAAAEAIPKEVASLSALERSLRRSRH